MLLQKEEDPLETAIWEITPPQPISRRSLGLLPAGHGDEKYLLIRVALQPQALVQGLLPLLLRYARHLR